MQDIVDLSYLYTPCDSVVTPPISGNIHELPFKQLSWENFEKLCLRIVETQYGIDGCEIIGRGGHKQEGLDIFALKADGNYETYQCKKYKKFKKADFQKVYEDFKNGKYIDKTNRFTLFTSDQLNSPELQLEFDKFKKTLNSEGIEFIKMDSVQLNRILKSHALIVYDFFGREWTRKFNGKESLSLIQKRRKLDSSEVIQLRRELLNLYTTVFHNYDPGIPSHGFSEDPNFLLEDRFIIPDIMYSHNSVSSKIVDSKPTTDNTADEKKERSMDTFNNPFSLITEYSSKRGVKHISPVKRINIDNELSKFKKVIVLGDPGAGKSALLRFVTQDILSKDPSLSNTSKSWGSLIPIWLPFAFLTKKINENDNLDLARIIEMWLISTGKGDLFKLVREALEDERLLLIVDGIDEWTEKSEANLSISKIEIQSKLLNTHVLYSSRPYGYRSLREQFQNVKELWLSPFSRKQQEEYVSNWYRKWGESIGDKSESYTQLRTETFMSEIDKSSDYKSLSKNPLLLSILISQRFRDSTLPKDKFKALLAITNQLIDKRPNQRSASAGITKRDNYEFELSDVFCELAFNIQSSSHEGIILKSDAKIIIQDYLIEMVGFEKAKAKKVSAELLDVGANNIGIIIEKSSDEIGFAHRQFQEFLASKYIHENQQSTTESAIIKYGGDQSWNEVITYFFNRIHLKKINDFKYFLDLLEPKEKEDLKSIYYIKFLKYKLILTLNNSPIKLAKSTLRNLVEEFIYEGRGEVKSILWNIFIDSFQNQRLRDEVLKILSRFLPNEIPFNDNRIGTIKDISKKELTQSAKLFLIQSLINGNKHQRLDASQMLTNLVSDRYCFDKLYSVINECNNPMIVGYAINSFISDSVDTKTKARIYKKFKDNKHSLIAFFIHKMKVHLQNHTTQDLDSVLEVIEDVHYTLDKEKLKLLVAGWSGTKELKRFCLETIDGNGPSGIHDREIAWTIMIRHYNNDTEIIKRICLELENEYPFAGMDRIEGWNELSYYFKGNQEISNALDKWIPKQKYNEPEVSFACLLGTTAVAKRYLMDNLPLSGTSHWYTMALLEGWGSDNETIDFLKSYFKSDNDRKFMAAQYVSQVFKDEAAEGIRILEEILFNRNYNFRERALTPLIELDKDYFKEKLLVRFVNNELITLAKDIFGQFYTAVLIIVDTFNGEEVVDDFVLKHCVNDPSCSNILKNYYPELFDLDENFENDLPLENKYRSIAVDRLRDQLDVHPELIKIFAKYRNETDETISMKMGIAYFNFLKLENKEEVVRLSEETIDYRGHDYQTQRAIAFGGYLLTKELGQYKSLAKKNSKGYFGPKFSRHFTNLPPSFSKLLVRDFDYLIEVFGEELELFFDPTITERNKWAFWAEISDSSSPTHPLIMNYIANTYESIEDTILIEYLNNNSPRSIYLKRIALRLLNSHSDSSRILAGRILGENFSEDEEVFDELISMGPNEYHSGKLLALSIGWANSEELKKCFERIINHKPTLNYTVVFRLKFLFRDEQNIFRFMMDIFNDYSNAKRLHRYYFQGLVERVNHDEKLIQLMNLEFVKTNSISIQISFYRLLDRANRLTEESIQIHKSRRQLNDNSKIGYNVLKNRLETAYEAFNPVAFE